MATINTIVLSGRLAADPELRYTNSGTAVANGSIAVTDGYGDNEKSYFFNYEAWKHNAEYMANYAKKGTPVTIAGKLTQQTWQAQDGSNRSKVVITVQEVILPPKQNNSNAAFSDGPALGEEVVFDDNDLPF